MQKAWPAGCGTPTVDRRPDRPQRTQLARLPPRPGFSRLSIALRTIPGIRSRSQSCHSHDLTVLPSASSPFCLAFSARSRRRTATSPSAAPYFPSPSHSPTSLHRSQYMSTRASDPSGRMNRTWSSGIGRPARLIETLLSDSSTDSARPSANDTTRPGCPCRAPEDRASPARRRARGRCPTPRCEPLPGTAAQAGLREPAVRRAGRSRARTHRDGSL